TIPPLSPTEKVFSIFRGERSLKMDPHALDVRQKRSQICAFCRNFAILFLSPCPNFPRFSLEHIFCRGERTIPPFPIGRLQKAMEKGRDRNGCCFSASKSSSVWHLSESVD